MSAAARPPLVLLAGMNCSRDLWRDLDLDPALTPEIEAATLDEQVAVLLARLPPRSAVVGLSLGGIVAMALARRAPERVAGLCLLSTNARSPTPAQRQGWDVALDRLAAGESARDLQRDLVPSLLSAAASSERPELVERTLAMADAVGGDRLAAQLRLQGTRVDERPGLAQLAGPVAVIAGEHDALCPVERHEEIRDRVPAALLTGFTVIEGCGHLSPVEQPAAVTTAITQWYQRVR